MSALVSCFELLWTRFWEFDSFQDGWDVKIQELTDSLFYWNQWAVLTLLKAKHQRGLGMQQTSCVNRRCFAYICLIPVTVTHETWFLKCYSKLMWCFQTKSLLAFRFDLFYWFCVCVCVFSVFGFVAIDHSFHGIKKTFLLYFSLSFWEFSFLDQ